MIALAGHGKDPRLVQPSLIPEFQIGDRVIDKEKFEGVLTSINDKHFTIKNEDNIKCFNLSLHKKPIHKLISHISISSAGLEHSPKLADVQRKSAPSPIATSTNRRNKSMPTTSQMSQSIPISEVTAHAKELICSQGDSLVLELPTLETSKDLVTQNQPCGLNFSESSMKDSPSLSSLKTPPQSLITDYEQYLEDCEWLDIVGTIHKSYKLLSLEAPKREKDCSSLPTLTTGQGSERNAGQTRLEKALKDKGFRPDTQVLSAEGMSVLFGFPPNWAKSICSSPKESPTETTLDGYSGEQSISTVQPSQLNESSISIAVSANNIDARLQFLLEQRDRLIASGASPEGIWINCGKVSGKNFEQAVWKSNKARAEWEDKKSCYIGERGKEKHLSAIAQHKGGQELRKIEREIKSIQKKLVKS
jgi:hypothetical protein